MSWTHATTNLYQPCGLSAFDQRENQRTSQRRCTLSSQARTNLQSLTDIFNFLSSLLFFDSLFTSSEFCLQRKDLVRKSWRGGWRHVGLFA